MATEEEIKTSEENFEWTAENEIHFFEAVTGHKPVGINKYFHMACICEKFESLMGRSVSPEVIWKHLENMFDMPALDKKESLPFPNDEEEFSLPEAEFSELINEKITNAKTEPVVETPTVKDGRTTPKVVKETAQTKENTSKKDKEKDKEKEKEKDKKFEPEETESESDKKEPEEPETEVKKGKAKKEKEEKEKEKEKEKQPPPKRGKRSTTAKKADEEAQAVNTNNKATEEDSHVNNKKEKQVIGKRTLRSRGDDSSSNKSATPPPAKRARRI